MATLGVPFMSLRGGSYFLVAHNTKPSHTFIINSKVNACNFIVTYIKCKTMYTLATAGSFLRCVHNASPKYNMDTYDMFKSDKVMKPQFF